jgi:hypothetical protein
MQSRIVFCGKVSRAPLSPLLISPQLPQSFCLVRKMRLVFSREVLEKSRPRAAM